MKAILFGVVLSLIVSDTLSQVESTRTSTHFDINPDLVTPDAADGARRLYQFLNDNYGLKIISGAMTLNSFDEIKWLKENTGKEPALIGLDFMHSGRGYTWYNDKQPIEDAKTFYERNGIPAICWHWRDPLRKTEEFYTAKTTFDVSKIFDQSSDEYKAMIADIDYIAGLLKELQIQNIPVVWRPLHEAAGGWFWWGAKGAEPCKELYRIMFDRMVKHHGLNNLIWVWTREPNDDAWYPGEEYVDIVGRDIYREGNHGSQHAEWVDMHERYKKKKMVAITECGSCPDADDLVEDKAAWSWYMPWYGQFVRDSKHNSLEFWKKMFSHEYVLTLDEMPDLKTYEHTPHTVVANEKYESEEFSLFPTVADDTLYIKARKRVGKVTIADHTGRKVLEQQLNASSGSLLLSTLPAGTYFVTIRSYPAVRIIKR